MSRKIASAGLTHFFSQEVEEDPNATLGTARDHLRGLGESALDDSAARPTEWILEVEELIEAHEEHCPLADFLPDAGSRTDAGPGVHG